MDEQPDGVIRLLIRVKPGASRTHVGGAYGEPPALVVAVTAPAVDGMANDAVTRALAQALTIKNREIVIVGGLMSRTKVVELRIEDPYRVQEVINRLMMN